MNPSGGSDYDQRRSSDVSPAFQQGVTFDALSNNEVQNTGSLDADPNTNRALIDAEEREAEQQLLANRMNKSRTMTVKFIIMGLAVLVGLMLVVLRHKASDTNLNSSKVDASQRFPTTSIPLADISSNSSALSVQNSQTLSINGQLNVNNSLVLAPTAQPTQAVTGQLYYDQTTNGLSYYNGTSFVDVLSGSQPVSSLGGETGNITTGNGLAVSGNAIRNTGVLTLQGENGNVSLVAGSGIAISGTTISNSGLLSLGGQGGNILLGTGLSLNGNTLNAQSGVQNLSAATNNVTVANMGNGTWSIGVSVSGGSGSGTVASSGGTVGKLAYFAGVQDIEDSLVSQSGTTITVGGNLVVTGGLSLGAPLTVANGGTGATTTAGARTSLGAAASGANSDITSLSGLTTALSVSQGGIGVGVLPTNSVLIGNGTSALTGVVAGAAGECLISTNGAPSFQTCPGSGGVSSLNSLTGALTIAGTSAGSVSASGNTITVNDATSAVKGLASFNSNDLTVTNGNVDTVQGIAPTSTPTFGQLTLTSSQATGTMLSVNNTNASATGNLLNLALNGSSRLSVEPNGNLTSSGTINGQTIGSAANFTGSLTVATNLSVNNITPSSSLTVGVGTQTFTLQGNTSSSIVATNGTSSTTVAFQSPTANVTYNFASAVAGSYNICTTAGNCVGVGGGVTSPGGTANTLAMFTGSNAIGNSIISESGSTITVAGTLSVNTITPTAALTVGSTSQALNLQGAGVTVADTAGTTTNSLVFSLPSGSAKTITLPNASGTVAVSASGPISLDASGNLSCPTCLTSGGGGGSAGVSSVNAATGALILQGTDANSITTVGTTITVNDATSTTKGLASFNATDLKVTTGNVDTVQSIAVTASPTFAGLTLSSALTVANGGTGATTAAGARTSLGAAASGANSDITSLSGLTTALSVLQGGTGATTLTANGVLIGNGTSPVTAVAGSNGQCLMVVAGTPAFSACPGSGVSSVSSLDGLTGALTINNSTGTGSTVTINNAKADGTTEGIASFNSTNFTDNGFGVINTIQNISSSASPSFAGLSLGSALTVANGGTGATTAAGARTGLGAAASGANSDITSLSGLTTALSVSQGGTGLSALTSNEILFANSTSSISQLTNGTAGLCLMSNGAASAPSFQTCTGAGGVSSLNGLTGTISIANATTGGSIITIQNALADGTTKGIATFNSTNFLASSGVINTVQNINTTASPTFANITISSTINANTITPSGAMVVGATGQKFTLQGNNTSTITATGGSGTTTVDFSGTATGNVTYQFDTAASAGTYTVCTTTGNCAGVGGGITGSGAADRLAVFTGTGSIGNSDITDNSGSSISISSGVSLGVQGSATFENATNSTTAFQIQNASASSLLTADTSNMRLGVDVTYSLMTTPTGVAVGAATAGGSLAASTTYYYKVTALDSAGGETTASTEANGATTASNKTLPVTWISVTGASGYNIYRSTTSGTEVYLTTVLTNSFTDTGSFTAGTATPPATTSAYTSAIASNNQLQLSIGGLGKPTGQLYVSGTVPSTVAGSVVTGSAPTVIKVMGSYAYVVNFSGNSLQIFNVSNASDPIAISTTSTGANTNPAGLDIKGSYAYVTYNFNNSGTGDKLVVYNIANPTSPTVVGSVATDASPNRVTVQGKYAYVTTGNNTLQIFDISNPASPTKVSTTSTGASSNPLNVFVLGNYAYVTDNGSSDLQIFDISNPASPTSVSVTALGGTAYGVYVQGSYAYVTVFSTNTLKIFDISNPASPTQVGSLSAGSNPANIYVQGRYAYLTDKGGNSFATIDVSDPYSPALVGSTTASTSPLDMAVRGNYVYVIGNGSNILQTFNIGGAYIQEVQAGGVDTGTLNTNGAANIAGNATIQGSISVGSTANFGGNIGVNGSATIGGSISIAGGVTGGVVINSLSTPSAPTITNVGTAGTTSYSYTVAAVSASGGITPASSAGSTSTGNATLSGTNYNQISWTPVSGATSYKVYRTVGGATQGLLGTTSGTVYNDLGGSGSGSAQTIDTSGQLELGASAGSGFFLNNGSTQYAVDSSQSFSANGTIANINNYSAILITATTSGLTLTLPDPGSTTAGKILYISNNSAGSNAFTLSPTHGSSMPLSTGVTTTLLWNGSSWTYSGTDASSILNQNSTTQTANFKISGTGTAAALQASSLDVAAAGTLTIGSTTATTISIGATTGAVTQTINIGNDATSGASETLSIGASTGAGTTTLQSGSGLLLIKSNTGALTLQAGGTSNLNIGTNGISNTIQIGNTANGVSQTINIGNNATAGSTDTVVLGSQMNSSTTTIQGGTGSSAINLTTAAGGSITATAFGTGNINLNATSTIVKTNSNNVNAFTVDNATGGYVLNVDTATNTVGIGYGILTPASSLGLGIDTYFTGEPITIGSTDASSVSIGASGSINNSSTIDIATSSSATNTQAVTIGSTANTANTTTLQASTSSIAIANSGINFQGNNVANNNVFLFQGNGTIASSGSVGTFFANTTSAQTALAAVSTFGQSSATGTFLVQSKNGSTFTTLFGVGATGQVTATTLSGSTSAFVIQDSGSGTNLLNADTTNNQITLNGNHNDLVLNMTSAGNENGILFETTSSVIGEIGFSGTAGQIINQSQSGDLALKSISGNILLAAGGSAGQIKVSGTNGSVAFQNSADSSSALTVLNQAGTATVFTVDTSNKQIIIGSNASDPTGVAGAMYYNSTLGKFRCYEGIWKNCVSGVVYANTTVPTGNTITATTATNFTSSYTIPANDCQPGRVYTITAQGLYTTASGTSNQHILYVYWGSTAILSSPGGAATGVNGAVTPLGWRLEAQITCVSTTAVEAQGLLTWINDLSGVGAYIESMDNTGTISVTTNSSQSLQLGGQWNLTGGSMTLRQYIVNVSGP